jgi:hypothetical protein
MQEAKNCKRETIRKSKKKKKKPRKGERGRLSSRETAPK